jgi:hypothetical protein
VRSVRALWSLSLFGVSAARVCSDSREARSLVDRGPVRLRRGAPTIAPLHWGARSEDPGARSPTFGFLHFPEGR